MSPWSVRGSPNFSLCACITPTSGRRRQACSASEASHDHTTPSSISMHPVFTGPWSRSLESYRRVSPRRSGPLEVARSQRMPRSRSCLCSTFNDLQSPQRSLRGYSNSSGRRAGCPLLGNAHRASRSGASVRRWDCMPAPLILLRLSVVETFLWSRRIAN